MMVYTKAGERDFGRLGGLTLMLVGLGPYVGTCTYYRKANISSCFCIAFVYNNIYFRRSYLQRKTPILGKEIKHRLLNDSVNPDQ